MPETSLPVLNPTVRANARRGHGLTTLLVWHDIVPTDQKIVWFDTTPVEFAAQLKRLLAAGAHPISLDALDSYLQTGTPTPPPGAVVLCFDDNTHGIYQFAFPLLRRYRFPFVVSVHTAYVGVRTSKQHNTWAELREMERGGGYIVSQTHTHPPDLRLLSTAALNREMLVSRRIMATMLGHPVAYLTYPSGKWDIRVARAAQRAGYRLALTEDYGTAETSPHLLGVHRFSTHRRFDEAVVAIRHSAKPYP